VIAAWHPLTVDHRSISLGAASYRVRSEIDGLAVDHFLPAMLVDDGQVLGLCVNVIPF